MNKFYILVITMFIIMMRINAAEYQRPSIFAMIDPLVVTHTSATQWPEVFVILDRMKNVIDVNEYAKNGYNLLNIAAGDGNFLAVKTLLEKYGAGSNMQSGAFGTTPLMDASGIGDAAIVQKLLMHGADPYLENFIGANSFYFATRVGRNGHVIVPILNTYQDIILKK
jgi:hypothetical protein